MEKGQSENGNSCLTCCRNFRRSKKLILFIVFSALFVDCLLLTVVVPIVPNVLRTFDEQNRIIKEKNSDTSTDSVYSVFSNSVNSTFNNFTNHNSTPSFSDVQFSDHKVEVGLLLGSKVLVQLIVNPFVGLISRRVGYSMPMVFGFFVTFISTIGFAFGNSYWILLVARAIQGIGSSCATVAGLGWLAATYTDDNERGTAMSIALSGMALGVTLGPPYGGIMYEFTGKEIPFIIIAVISLFDGCMRLCVLQTPKQVKLDGPSSSTLAVLKDPYVLIVSGGMIISTMAIAVLEASLPIWMHETMNAAAWQQGVAFIEMTLPYVLGTNLFGCIGNKIGRWITAILGFFIIAAGLSTIPLATNQYVLIPPLVVLGLAIGMLSSSLFPTMGYLVDIRQLPSYADVFALADSCVCVGFLIGPVVSGAIYSLVGFNWLMWIFAILNVVYSPLLIFIRNPKPKAETLSLIKKDEVVTHYYGDEEMYCKSTENGNENAQYCGDDEDGFECQISVSDLERIEKKTHD